MAPSLWLLLAVIASLAFLTPGSTASDDASSSSTRSFPQPLQLRRCQVSNFGRSLEGRGAHRNLQTRFRISCSLLILGQESRDLFHYNGTWNSCVLIRQQLPRELFVDPFEVQRSPKAGVQVSLEGAVELEKPAGLCDATVADMWIDMNLHFERNPVAHRNDPTIQRPDKDKMQNEKEEEFEEFTAFAEVDTSLPLHSRYPEILGESSLLAEGNEEEALHSVGSTRSLESLFVWPCKSSHVEVVIPHPALKLASSVPEGCPKAISSKYISWDDSNMLSTNDSLSSNSLPLIWPIPVACAAHSTLVSLATGAVALSGAICVIVSTYQSQIRLKQH